MKVKFDTKGYVLEEIKEALGPDNQWFAGEQLGRKPTAEEAVAYYIENGGSTDFRKRRSSKFWKSVGDPQQ